jgi:pimeloyl-ACP methyl ester carboxylesterase
MLQEHFFHTGKINLNYAEGPDNGPPLVLLHGGSTRWQGFTDFIGPFVDDWHIYAPDMRGHGKSDHVPYQYSIRDMAEDVVAFMRFIGEPAVVFGHSLGGHIAIMAARQIPHLLRALIIGDAPLSKDDLRQMFIQDRQKLLDWAEMAGKPPAHIIEGLKAMHIVWGGVHTPRPAHEIFGESAPYFTKTAENLSLHDPTFLTVRVDDFEGTHAGFDIEHLLSCIHCPTLILQGDPNHHGLVTDAQAQTALRLLRNGALVKLDGIGHGLYYEKREPVVQAVQEFLAAVK